MNINDITLLGICKKGSILWEGDFLRFTITTKTFHKGEVIFSDVQCEIKRNRYIEEIPPKSFVLIKGTLGNFGILHGACMEIIKREGKQKAL